MKKKLTYYLSVLGCQMNKSDSERLETILQQLGYVKTDQEEKADFISVVSCAVRQSAMDRIYGKVRRWNLLKEKKHLVTMLTGCVLKQDKEKLKYQFDILLDMKDIQKLPEKLKKKNMQASGFLPAPSYLQLEPRYESSFKAYVPIMTGCNKFCTYCAVPYTRGSEISRPPKEIYEEIKNLIKKGYKEITLLGQNVNAYGNDFRVKETMGYAQKKPTQKLGSKASNQAITFPKLLREINSWPGNFWLRFITSHPYDMSDELIEVMAERGHIAEYLHLPVQSGNNVILKKMNRHYTVSHYLERVENVRKKIPNISVSTDIIVGFCGETEKQFRDTARLMEKVGYDMAYIAQYSPRPGTAAERAWEDDVPRTEKKKREKILTDILSRTALAFNKKFIGATTTVLVDGAKKGKLFGKNRQFKNVQFPGPKGLVGEFVDIKITKATPWGLEGKMAHRKNSA